jgi:hypothetical protein
MDYYLFVKPGRSIENKRQLDKAKYLYPHCEVISVESYENPADYIERLAVLKKNDRLICDSPLVLGSNDDERTKTFTKLISKDVDIVYIKTWWLGNDSLRKAVKICKGGHISNETVSELFYFELQQYQEQLSIDAHIREHTLASSKRMGKQIGQKQGITLETKKSIEAKEKIAQQSKDFGGELSDIELMEQLTLSRNSFYKYKKELKNKK